MNASDFEKNRIRIPHRSALPLSRSNMPSGYEISLKHYTQNRSVRIPEDLGPPQSLKGFDPAYRNIIDYIVRITYRIWETLVAGSIPVTKKHPALNSFEKFPIIFLENLKLRKN